MRLPRSAKGLKGLSPTDRQKYCQRTPLEDAWTFRWGYPELMRDVSDLNAIIYCNPAAMRVAERDLNSIQTFYE